MRVPGCSKLAYLTGSWSNFLYKFQKGLNGVHSDKSAANNCNLRQWRSQQPSCLAYIETCSSFCLLRAQLEVSNTSSFVWSLYWALVWLWYFECERPVCPWDSPCSVNWYAHKQNHQLWLEQSGHFTRIQLSFQTLSTHLKPRGSPTQQQALNVHFNTTRSQKDVQLLWFAQNYYECGSFAQICPHVFPGSLPHKDIGIGKVMRVPRCSKLANFTGSWSNFLYKFQKGLNGVHSDESAANNCNLRQCRALMFTLHCTGWQVSSDRLKYANAVSLRNTDSDSSVVATETMR